MMRVKDFFYTILISAITSFVMIWILISAGVLQTHQPPAVHRIRQTIHDDFSISSEESFETFSYPIQNVTGSATSRIIHVYVEFNVTNNPEHMIVSIKLKLLDSKLQRLVDEVSSEPHEDYGLTTMTVSVNVDHVFFLQITVYGSDVGGFIQGTITQDIAV